MKSMEPGGFILDKKGLKEDNKFEEKQKTYDDMSKVSD
jgi:hypothetical protein